MKSVVPLPLLVTPILESISSVEANILDFFTTPPSVFLAPCTIK